MARAKIIIVGCGFAGIEALEVLGAFSSWIRQGKAVFYYFNNDQAGYAVQNAMMMKTMA